MKKNGNKIQLETALGIDFDVKSWKDVKPKWEFMIEEVVTARKIAHN